MSRCLSAAAADDVLPQFDENASGVLYRIVEWRGEKLAVKLRAFSWKLSAAILYDTTTRDVRSKSDCSSVY